MKYFKYPFYTKILNNENRERFKNLDKEAQKNNRKNKTISIGLILLYFIIFTSIIALIKCLLDLIDNKLLETFMMIGMIIALLIIPIVIIAFIYKLIKRFISPSTVGELTLKNIQEATKPLRRYYKVNATCIITKCYKCSNEAFNNKDVIIFLYKNRIRITLDFNHTLKDFGCYEFTCEEIESSYVRDGNLIKTLVKVEKDEFYLGKKAKSFINRLTESILYIDELNEKIRKYNSIKENHSVEQWSMFKEIFNLLLVLDEKKIIISDAKKKKISYLMDILENDGPEYAYIIDFSSALNDKDKYQIGVCVRGAPLIKKI